MTTFTDYESLPIEAQTILDNSKDTDGEIDAIKATQQLREKGYIVETDYFCWIIESISMQEQTA